MVTTRAQAKRESSLMTDTEGTSEERPAESDSLKTTEDISATNAPNGEYSEPTKEVETVEQRREEEPASGAKSTRGQCRGHKAVAGYGSYFG